MAFIKLENVVINTAYIAAVVLDGETSAGESSVSILVAAPNLPQFQKRLGSQFVPSYEWLEFTGEAANVLRDYFSSFNHVVDLLPHYQHSVAM
ncbi:MAG: hypothetical protein HC936_01785 [Leptolyngbyaceae cyanobacterium SU_3_3]|nr:hypothetical protein [Leptolyngbyaceae cyanobacterium SU_3_3]NJR51359.1 hypothetical protein [Leptolyngbyaceae cyanobacterium CSU_1_3]